MDIRKKQVETNFTKEAKIRTEVKKKKKLKRKCERERDFHIHLRSPLYTDLLLKGPVEYHLPHSFTYKQDPF